MDDIDDLVNNTADALGSRRNDIEPITKTMDEPTLTGSISFDKDEIIKLMNNMVMKLETLANENPTVDTYLELSDTYLALGTITKDKEILRKSVSAAEEVIKIKQKENYIIDNAEQNRRAAAERMGEPVSSYSSYSSYTSGYSSPSWKGGLEEATDMFNINTD